MRKETLEVATYPFMEEMGIAPIELDQKTMDLRPEFRERLRNQLKSGWRSDQKLVIAKSKDPRLDGQLVQGRHRCIEIGELIKSDFPFDTSKILFSFETVKTADDLRTLISAYEDAATTSKDPAKSRAWIKSNIATVVKNNVNKLDNSRMKMLEYLHSKGFVNDDLSLEIIDSHLESIASKAEKRRLRKKKQDERRAIPEHLRDRRKWGQPEVTEKIEVEENARTYPRDVEFICEHCGKTSIMPVNVIISDDGRRVKVTQVKLTISR